MEELNTGGAREKKILETRIIMEGMQARKNSKKLTDNPYEIGSEKHAWWKNGWFKTSIVSTFIFLMGMLVNQALPIFVSDRSPDYRIENDYLRMTWTFKEGRPEGSKNYKLEELVIQYFAANFAMATMVSSDSGVNGVMLARLVFFMKLASDQNLITADSVIKADSIAAIGRKRPNRDSTTDRLTND